MEIIKSIRCRKVLNSHVKFTNEFVVELADGSIGFGGSPQGETISIYEDKKIPNEPEIIIEMLKDDDCCGKKWDQESFDAYLQEHIPVFGRNNAFGLSLGFFNAKRKMHSLFDLFKKPEAKLFPPRIALNILNGGWHAYTNPVLSDFSEFMLVSRSDNLEEVIANHNEIQQTVRERLLCQAKTVVSGNPVNSFSTPDNREAIEFLLNVIDSLRLSNQFDLMIDASAGDLWTAEGYQLSITDHSIRSPEAFCEYWLDMIRQYNIRFLEDPFHEQDFNNWQRLTASQPDCCIIGDNLYSSDAGRIGEGSLKRYTHAVVIKPNQSGTVTAVRRAIEAAQSNDQIAIASHRSISTESIFISILTCIYRLKYIKIGPLQSDYSSVVRFNEIIRITGGNYDNGDDNPHN